MRMPCVNISHLNDPRHHPSGRSFRITSPERLRQPYIIGKQPSSIAESGLRCNACSAVTTNHSITASRTTFSCVASSHQTIPLVDTGRLPIPGCRFSTMTGVIVALHLVRELGDPLLSLPRTRRNLAES